jgi:hypothetical protein
LSSSPTVTIGASSVERGLEAPFTVIVNGPRNRAGKKRLPFSSVLKSFGLPASYRTSRSPVFETNFLSVPFTTLCGSGAGQSEQNESRRARSSRSGRRART